MIIVIINIIIAVITIAIIIIIHNLLVRVTLPPNGRMDLLHGGRLTRSPLEKD